LASLKSDIYVNVFEPLLSANTCWQLDLAEYDETEISAMAAEVRGKEEHEEGGIEGDGVEGDDEGRSEAEESEAGSKEISISEQDSEEKRDKNKSRSERQKRLNPPSVSRRRQAAGEEESKVENPAAQETRFDLHSHFQEWCKLAEKLGSLSSTEPVFSAPLFRTYKQILQSIYQGSEENLDEQSDGENNQADVDQNSHATGTSYSSIFLSAVHNAFFVPSSDMKMPQNYIEMKDQQTLVQKILKDSTKNLDILESELHFGERARMLNSDSVSLGSGNQSPYTVYSEIESWRTMINSRSRCSLYGCGLPKTSNLKTKIQMYCEMCKSKFQNLQNI